MKQTFGLRTLVCVSMAWVLLSSSWVNGQDEQKKPEQSSVVVELYLIQIPQQTLNEIGVSALPLNESSTITIQQINQALSLDGKVVSAVRGLTASNERFIYNLNHALFIKSTGGRPNQFQQNARGEFYVNPISENKFKLSINFNYDFPNIEDNQENEKSTSDMSKVSLNSNVILQNDKPAIVSFLKTDKYTLYLIARVTKMD